ncbi:MAG: hypothetical protein PVF15_05310 [Candidatus Bathyarchaeota archaeon]
METEEWKQFVDEIKTQWKALWRERINDKTKAEGIANRDYSMLFVEQGLVVIATRDFKPPDFFEILGRHMSPEMIGIVVPPHPSVGGWRKFVKNFISKPKQFTKRGRPIPPKPKNKDQQQLRKSGRGWIHFRMR